MSFICRGRFNRREHKERKENCASMSQREIVRTPPTPCCRPDFFLRSLRSLWLMPSGYPTYSTAEIAKIAKRELSRTHRGIARTQPTPCCRTGSSLRSLRSLWLIPCSTGKESPEGSVQASESPRSHPSFGSNGMFGGQWAASAIVLVSRAMPLLPELGWGKDGLCYRHGAPNGDVPPGQHPITQKTPKKQS